jgi:hypothetical protein
MRGGCRSSGRGGRRIRPEAERATFRFSIASPISADTTIAASAMTSCMTHASACESATFYIDAAAAGLAPDHHDWQGVELASAYSASYYYFEAPTFTADGMHADVFGVGPATLTVDAPPVAEPATIALLGAGLPLLLAASRRKRGVATP